VDNVSQGRWPDGMTDLYFMPTPTPAASNVILSNPPPEIHIIAIQALTEERVAITWSSEAGRNYRLQYTDNVDDETWSDLPEVTAIADLTSMTNQVSGVLQRFYRVQAAAP